MTDTPGAAIRSRVVLFDFWGVFGLVQSDGDVARMARAAQAPVDRFIDVYWAQRAEYDTGGSPQDYWMRVADGLGATLPAAVVEQLTDLDTRSWLRTDPAMIDLAADLAATGQRMAVLSNAPTALVEFARSGPLSRYVHPMMFSCEIGLAKPDPGIFRAACDELDVPPSEVVFVDDRLHNVQAAQSIGMAGIHHRSAAETRRLLLG